MTAATAKPPVVKYTIKGIAPALLRHRDLNACAKGVAVALLMHRNEKSGLCYPKVETLLLELGISKSSVLRALTDLKAAGLIDWKKRSAPCGGKGRGNLYDLTGLLSMAAGDALSQLEATHPQPGNSSPKRQGKI